MTGSATDDRSRALSDRRWWDGAIGRAVRTFWHSVGFYLGVVPVVRRLAAVGVVGATPTLGPLPLPITASVAVAVGAAVALSSFAPTISSARTLAFGVLAALLFELLQVALGRHQVAGRPAVVLDVALAGVGALSGAAAVAFGPQPSLLRSGESEA